MTSRQTGRTISAISMAQRRGKRTEVRSSYARSRSVRGNTPMSGAEKRRLAQFVVCGAIFITLVAVKLLLPAKMVQLGDKLSSLMNRNMDITEVFSAVGRAVSGEESVSGTLSDVYEAVFHPEEDGAVETAARVESRFGEPSAIQSLHAFTQGQCGDDAWLSLPSSQRTAAETVANANVDENGQSASTSASTSAAVPEANAMNLSYVLYSDENVPANVCMEQNILDFDYCTPVCGVLSSGFGYREHPIEGEEKFHYGIDIAADPGTEIDCFAGGSVTAVGESSSYGKYLIVSHKDGYSTLYAHCSKITVSSGTKVSEGQKIAEVGETGLCTGPHLHFELHWKGEYLNPIYYVTLS